MKQLESTFKGKVAIVTGGASGIGRALCVELARQGVAMVVAADIDEENARQTALGIQANGGKACARHVDVSQSESVRQLIEGIATEFGRLDYQFNNAGITICGEVRDMTLTHWKQILDVNLWGVIYGTTYAYQVMLRQGYGHIVNTASLDGLTPMPMSTPYTTAKHGVVGLSTALRLEAAPLGIKVSVACPGAVRTQVFESATYVGVAAEAVKKEMMSEFNLMDPADSARNILRGVARNESIILDATHNRIFWWIYRLNPDLYGKLISMGAGFIRKHRLITNEATADL